MEVLCSRVEAFCRSAFKLFDRGGHGRDFVLHTRNTALFDACTSGLGRDDLNSSRPRAGIGFIALVVIPMKVCFDNKSDRLGCELFDLLDEGAGSGRLRVGVDNEDAVVEQDDRGVAIDFEGWLGNRGVDTFCDGLDVEQVVRHAVEREK
jgi:hypothetical protein